MIATNSSVRGFVKITLSSGLLSLLVLATPSLSSDLILTEQAKLLGRGVTIYEGCEGTRLGYSVAISGDRLVAGAPDDSEEDCHSGAAFVFSRDSDGAWSEEGRLVSSSAGYLSYSGRSVDIDDDSAILGVSEDEDNRDGAYVFVRNASGEWLQQAVLYPGDSPLGDDFAYNVAIDGDTALVSRHGTDLWRPSDPGEDIPPRDPTAVVFVRDELGGWTQQAELAAANEDIALDGDVAVISGSIFERDASGVWSKQEVQPGGSVVSSESNAVEGYAVEGNTVVVGANLYTRDSSGQWVREYLTAAPEGTVFLSNGPVIIGTGILDDSDTPAKHVYRWTSSEWTRVASLVASDGGLLGPAAIDGDTVVVGAPLDDEIEPDGGAVYVFSLPSPPIIAINDGPYAIDEGSALAGDVNILDNDTDPEGDPLTPIVVDPPEHASFFQVMPDGTFDYTHDGSETTSDSFTYRASDGVNESEIATVSLEIAPVNDAPRILLIGEPTITVEGGDVFSDPGATAEDPEDGDISDSIVVGGDIVDTAEEGSYVITYNVADADGLAAAEVTRTVIVEIDEPPVIALIGPATVVLDVGDTYAEQGATAEDPEDGDLTDKITIDNPVDTSIAGTYKVTYTVMDSAGHQAKAERTVIVEEAPPPPPPTTSRGGGGGGGAVSPFEILTSILMLKAIGGRQRKSAIGRVL